MGKATIVGNQGAGQYTVRREYDGLDGELARLAAKRAQLETQLPILRNTEGKYWSEVVTARQALDTLISQWIAGTI